MREGSYASETRVDNVGTIRMYVSLKQGVPKKGDQVGEFHMEGKELCYCN